MFPTKFYDPDIFIQAVIEDCQLGDMPSEVRERLEEAIAARISERIVSTVMVNLQPEDVQTMNDMRADYPEMDEFDIMLVVSTTLPHLREKLEKNMRDLYEELTYDATRIEESMKLREQQS